MELANTLLKHFSNIQDPRRKTHQNFRHKLTDILVITILATLCAQMIG